MSKYHWSNFWDRNGKVATVVMEASDVVN